MPLTLQECAGKVHAQIRVPTRVGSGVDSLRYLLRLNLVHFDEEPITVSKTDHDLGHAQEKGLNPELHELAVEDLHIFGAANLQGCLELNPIDRLAVLDGLRVPDCRCLLVCKKTYRE